MTHDPHSDEVCVFQASGEFEAQQVKSYLEAHGIRCVLRGESLRVTHGFTLDGHGVVRLLVTAGDEDAARELLRQAESGEVAVEEPDDDPGDG